MRPQLFVGFLVACLCVGALGNAFRPAHASPVSGDRRAILQGAAPTGLTPPNCAAIPCIAFSFDDGPDPTVTPRVLDILAAEHVKATFFMVGHRVPGNEHLLQRMYYEGHEIGNHSWDHANLTRLSPEQFDSEIQSTQNAIARAGVPTPHLLRPPYGAVNDLVKSRAHMTIVRWDIDPDDWRTQDPARICQEILAQAKPGGIVLLHDVYPSTADALAPVIDQLRAANYQFVTVSQLMQLSPGDQGQYFGRWYPE